MRPDEQVFRDHLGRGSFRSGVARGRWRLLSLEWPYAVIAVAAAPRTGGPSEYAFRFQLTNYPTAAPTAQPWDADQDQPSRFDRRPCGPKRVSKAFRTDWKEGTCLYLPCDREALAGHDQWRTQHPSLVWTPEKDITHYLQIVHELLNSSDYTGPNRPEQSP